jgi:hypothetical protein
MVDVGERWAEKTNEAEQGTAWHHYQGRPDCTAPRPPRTLRNHRRPHYVCGLHVHFILHPRVIVWVILSHDGVARYLRNRKYIQYKRWQIVVMYVYLMFQLVFSCVCVCVCMCVCFRVHSKRQQAQSINISKHPSKPTSINLNTTIHTLI